MMRPEPVRPENGQESVWDYPRPPRLEPSTRSIEVRFEGELIAETQRAFRVTETSHPPSYYLPEEDIRMNFLRSATGSSLCEWKGQATYFDLNISGSQILQVAWTYLNPSVNFQPIAGYLAFYPNKVACFIEGERVQAQAGGFYGGWITSDIVGPFKGEPGTRSW